MAIVDKEGLPLGVSTHAANHREVALVQLGFQFYMIEAKPEKLIGDKAYDRDDLDLLAKEGIDLAPYRSNRRDDRKTQDLRSCAAIGADGSSGASSPGYNTSDDSSCDGSSIPPISLVSGNLLQSAFS